MNVFKKIFGNWVVLNLLIAAVLACAIFFGVRYGLRSFTQHNKTVEVPDLVGKSIPQAQALAEKDGLQLIVVDSVYVNRFTHGAVYSQNPTPGHQVKNGRKIYLTVNALRKKQVTVPSMVGLSVRQAKVELLANNLVLGKLNYVKDIATNNVLGQMIKGEEAVPGTKVDAGTVVDLKVGLSSDDPYTMVPTLYELPYNKAIEAVQNNYLNVNRVVFDYTVRSYSDSLAAFVYRQSPEPSENQIRMGQQVNIYLTLDKNRLPLPKVEETE